MFKRMSDALKTASNDRTYNIMMVLFFLVLVSNYVIKSPVIWVISTIFVVVMIGMLVKFFIKNEVANEEK